MTPAALEDAHLYVSPNAPAITGTALEALITEYRGVQALIERISRLYPWSVLDQMIVMPELTDEMMKNREQVVEWTEKLVASVDLDKTGASAMEASVAQDVERHIYLPQIDMVAHGVPRSYAFNHDFFHSAEYRAMVQLGQTLTGLLEEGAYMRRGERVKPMKQFSEGLEWIMTQAKRGYYIQRYKGLGEMNPDQLWETTMDPESRRMLRVNIEDAIAADQMFTTLMGDEVEPRREFIETNALTVTNLDV